MNRGVILPLAFLIAAIAHAETRLDFIPPLLHDTSGNPNSDPSIHRVAGGRVFTWHDGTQYLIYMHQLGLYKRELRSDGSLGGAISSHFGVPAYGDRDRNLFNFDVCDGCRYGIAGFDVQGTVVWDLGTGSSPLFGTSHRYIDGSSAGGMTFVYGTKQYMIGRLTDGCAGDSLVEVTGVEPADMRLIQCITDVVGTPLVTDGGIWIPNDDQQPGDPITGWIWLADRSAAERIHAYTVRSVGPDPDLSAVGWTIRAGNLLDHGFDVSTPQHRAVSAWQDGLSVWDIGDPAAPVRIAQVPLAAGHRTWSVEIRWPYVVVTAIHASPGYEYLFDIRDPLHPLDVFPEFRDPTAPWNSYPLTADQGGAWWGDDLFLTRYAIMERFRLVETGPEPLIFADGFETGDTSRWSGVVP